MGPNCSCGKLGADFVVVPPVLNQQIFHKDVCSSHGYEDVTHLVDLIPGADFQ
jgi:hypothetical protein